jgi:hypothetical protein
MTFQGPDWPYYDKRIIVGKKTKEEFLAAQAQADSTIAPVALKPRPHLRNRTLCPKMPR